MNHNLICPFCSRLLVEDLTNKLFFCNNFIYYQSYDYHSYFINFNSSVYELLTINKFRIKMIYYPEISFQVFFLDKYGNNTDNVINSNSFFFISKDSIDKLQNLIIYA